MSGAPESPVFVCDVWAPGFDPNSHATLIENCATVPDGGPMIYMMAPNQRYIGLTTIYGRPCGFVREAALMSHIRSGVRYNATKVSQTSDIDDGKRFVTVLVRFTPLPPARHHLREENRKLMDA